MGLEGREGLLLISFSATLKRTREACREGHCCLPRAALPFFVFSLSNICFCILFIEDSVQHHFL